MDTRTITGEIPCEKCVHNKVCSAKSCMKETEVKTTHPYVKVEIGCTEFLSSAGYLIKGGTRNGNE